MIQPGRIILFKAYYDGWPDVLIAPGTIATVVGWGTEKGWVKILLSTGEVCEAWPGSLFDSLTAVPADLPPDQW